MGRRLAAAGLLLVVQAPAALACGVCLEDKLAAVYDHAVVNRALAARHHVAFCGIEGDVASRQALGAEIARALGSVAGVERASVRVSLDHATVSFVYDPARTPLEAVLRAARRTLANRRLDLVPLRVMDRPAQLRPATR